MLGFLSVIGCYDDRVNRSEIGCSRLIVECPLKVSALLVLHVPVLESSSSVQTRDL